jgi:hypothetical protein
MPAHFTRLGLWRVDHRQPRVIQAAGELCYRQGASGAYALDYLLRVLQIDDQQRLARCREAAAARPSTSRFAAGYAIAAIPAPTLGGTIGKRRRRILFAVGCLAAVPYAPAITHFTQAKTARIGQPARARAASSRFEVFNSNPRRLRAGSLRGRPGGIGASRPAPVIAERRAVTSATQAAAAASSGRLASTGHTGPVLRRGSYSATCCSISIDPARR